MNHAWRSLALVLVLAPVEPAQAVGHVTAAEDTFAVSAGGLRTALVLTGAYCAGGVMVMENVWYRDQEIVPFHFFNDNGGYLQVDKFGHAFGAYFASYVGYHWLRRRGISEASALLYGGGLGLILQTPIELMDGIHEGWGFSWGDMAANALGSGLVVGQELLLGEQIVRYKFSYQPSPYADMANGYFGESFLNRMFEDYNGHTYWLTAPLRQITAQNRIPSWLHVAAGYSSNGLLGEFQNMREYGGKPIPETTRYRQFLLSLDVDWTRLSSDSRLLRLLLHGLSFIKVPFPALEMNSTGRIRGYWVYF